MIYVEFLRAADASRPDNDWEYLYNCPRDSLSCQTSSKLSEWSLGVCGVLILFFLFSDVIDGFLIIYEGITISDNWGITAGISLLFVTVTTMVTSIIYNAAICTSNTELFMNSAVLLFLNELDEKLYKALKKIFPVWLDELDADIKKKSSNLERRRKGFGSMLDLDDVENSSIQQSQKASITQSVKPRSRQTYKFQSVKPRSRQTYKSSINIQGQSHKASFLKKQLESLKSTMFHRWSVEKNEEEEDPTLLMIRAENKMDKLQEELDNVRKDFLKFSSITSSKSNRNVGEKIDFDSDEKGMPHFSNANDGVKIDNDDDEEGSMPKTSDSLLHEGSREVMQSHRARNSSIDQFDLSFGHRSDSNLNANAHYHQKGT